MALVPAHPDAPSPNLCFYTSLLATLSTASRRLPLRCCMKYWESFALQIDMDPALSDPFFPSRRQARIFLFSSTLDHNYHLL